MLTIGVASPSRYSSGSTGEGGTDLGTSWQADGLYAICNLNDDDCRGYRHAARRDRYSYHIRISHTIEYKFFGELDHSNVILDGAGIVIFVEDDLLSLDACL